MHTVAGTGGKSCAGALHGARAGHRVLSAYAHSINKQRDGIADQPAIQRGSPHGRQHDRSERENEGVLHHAEATADPISFNSNEDLSKDDTGDLQSINSDDPAVIARLVRLPALRPNKFEQRSQVSDGEEHVAFDQQAHTGDHVVGKVRANGTQRILLEHLTDDLELPPCLFVALLVDPTGLLPERKISPIGPGVARVAINRIQD